jgi:hypothetical protein
MLLLLRMLDELLFCGAVEMGTGLELLLLFICCCCW